MRLNKFIAQATSLSRRAADAAIESGRVSINGQPASTGQSITDDDIVKLDSQTIKSTFRRLNLLINKPVGYVCSRDGQGSKTIYDLLPAEYQHLQTVGRLDKDSSGLLLLTNDGQLAYELTHPKFQKEKVYQIQLNRALTPADQAKIKAGIQLDDGVSHLKLEGKGISWTVRMSEGRNRQIRRTFSALDYTVRKLHRTQLGPFEIGALETGKFAEKQI